MVLNVTTEKLKNLTSLITKGSTPTTYGYEFVEQPDSEASFFGAYNCTYEGEPKLDKRKWITLEANEMLARSQLSDKDTILCIVGNTIGSSFMVESAILPANINQNVALIRPIQEKIYPLYLRHIIQSPFLQHQIIQEASTQAQPSLSLKQVGDLNIFYPSLPEQQKIAKILSTWDKAISTTEHLIENSSQQKKALMQQLLTGKKRLLDESGQRFEGEWEEVKLKECANSLDNLRVPINSEQRQEMSGDTPYWGANGIVGYINDYIFDETIVLLAEDGGYFDEFANRPIANISYGKSWVNNHAHVLTAKDNTINEWLYYSLVNKNILAFINGGTRAKLNKSDMFLIPILIPPLKEQQKIVTVLTNADKEIELLEQQLADLQQEKKALMQVLLTGKKRVVVDGQ